MLASDRTPVILTGARQSSARQINLIPNGTMKDGILPWHLPLPARGCRIAGPGALLWIPFGRNSKVHDGVWKGGQETFAAL
ncbi:MAG: hypothetical protein MUC85_04680 [Anaerolineales bacterium]|jgi:hypothetical protein|nr:hypothetical protein [Anaerolineales bacterium]